MVGLTAILREAWNTAQNSKDKREKIQALSLAKECYTTKIELLTNATVVDDAIRFVSEKAARAANAEPKTGIHIGIDEEEKQQQEDNNKEQESDNNTTATTINQVF